MAGRERNPAEAAPWQLSDANAHALTACNLWYRTHYSDTDKQNGRK